MDASLLDARGFIGHNEVVFVMTTSEVNELTVTGKPSPMVDYVPVSEILRRFMVVPAVVLRQHRWILGQSTDPLGQRRELSRLIYVAPP